MSSKTSQDGNDGGAKGWDETEKYSLLLRIIDIYQSTHGKFDNKRLVDKYPERTPKALQHQWTRIMNEVRNLGDPDFVPPVSAKKTKTTRKTAAKANGGNDDTEGDNTPSKPKRGRKRAADTNGELVLAKKQRAEADATSSEEQAEDDAI